MRHQGRHDNKIIEGTYLQSGNGSVELVYAYQIGSEGDLEVNASNEVCLRAHDLEEFSQELYPLSESNLSEVEVCKPELGLRQPDMIG